METIDRGTRAFSCTQNGYPGGFPQGFLTWVKNKGWWGTKRCYLCSGAVVDPDSVRVDLEPSCNPTHLEDARNTSLPPNSFDLVIIDPPSSRELAESLYKKGAVWNSINIFTKEAARILSPGGLIITLSYEVPKRIPGCSFIAVWGVYQIPTVSYMRCFTVSRKEDPSNAKDNQPTL